MVGQVTEELVIRRMDQKKFREGFPGQISTGWSEERFDSHCYLLTLAADHHIFTALTSNLAGGVRSRTHAI
ncbi:MAG TPA: hypothetical protein VEW46_02105 [Pyrinomonadaceae bacterium]|nr:hypothetical protein [Pyrinomonadaceae bacterium]